MARNDRREVASVKQGALPIYDQVPPEPRVHKRQRQTAREVYKVRRGDDKRKKAAGEETRTGQVLRCLAAWWNRFNTSPTALELLNWMRERGEPVFDVNSIRPRLKELVDQGLVEPRAKRQCIVSGQTVWTWAVREAGSEEPRT